MKKPWITLNQQNGTNEILIYEPIGRDPWSDEGLNAKDFKEVIDKVEHGKDLTIRINSKGGDVYEGFTIRNLLDAWKGKVSVIIDGVAASTASWIGLGADEIKAAKNSQMFVHDAIAFGFGNAAELTKQAERLNITSDQIAQMYADKTGKSQTEMRDLMRKETLLTAEDALKLGLIDGLTDQPAISNFSDADMQAMKARLRTMNSQKTTAPSAGKTKEVMNRDQMLALLKEHGVSVANEATDEQLQAALKELLKTKNAKPDKPETPGPSNVIVLDQVNALKAQIDALKEANDSAKKLRVENSIDELIRNDQIPMAMRDKAVARAMKDDEYLNELRALPSRPPGAEPVAPTVVEVSSSPKDFINAYNRFQEPNRSWLRGNTVNMKNIAASSIGFAMFYNEHRDKIIAYLNAAGDNTIAVGLKRQVILQDALNAFSPTLAALRAFSTAYNNIPLQGTDKIDVPFYDLETAASTAWNAANGYVAGETSTDSREITINKRYYQSMGLTSVELARQPYLNKTRLVALKAEKLALDVFLDILSLVTEANYGEAGLIKSAGLFDWDSVVDLRTKCNNAEWPEVGRGLILNSDYDGALCKDLNAKDAINNKTARPGEVPGLLGFDYYRTNKVPANAQNLVGMAVHVSAILVAFSPIEPAPSVRKDLAEYSVVTDPRTGAVFEYKEFGSAQMDNEQSVIESNYGYAKGNASALKRITSS